MKIEKTLNNQIFFQKLPNKPKNNTQTKKDNNKKLSLSLDALASKNALIKPQLLSQKELEVVFALRKAMSTKSVSDVTEELIEQMMLTKSNEEFLEKISNFLKL